MNGEEKSLVAFGFALERYIRKIIKGLAVGGWIFILIMMIWITADVIAPIFHFFVPETINWIEVLNVIAFSLPLTYVTMTKAHITVDLIPITNKRAKHLREIFVLILMLLFTGVVAWQTSLLAWRSTLMLESQSLIIKVYWFPAKLALALSFLLSSIILLAQLITTLGGKGKNN